MNEAEVLERWRATRSPRLADILCCAFDRTWKARYTRLDHTVPNYALKHVLPELPDDPRTTLLLVRLFEAACWRAAKSRPVWTYVFERLVALRDVRCIPKLRALAQTPPDLFQPKTTAWAQGEIAIVADKLAALKIAKDDARTIALAEAQQVVPPKEGFFPTKSTADSDALLARVWDAPDDMALRSVVADALQELGDPWGELIALQLAGKSAKKLLAKHQARFAGPIADVAQDAYPRFENGFVVECTIGNYFATPRDWELAATARHWATVQRVEFAGEVPKRKWFTAWWQSGNLTSLREIAMRGAVFTRAASDAPWVVASAPANPSDYDRNAIALLPIGKLVTEARAPSAGSPGPDQPRARSARRAAARDRRQPRATRRAG